MREQRVVVFFDYQNVHGWARRRFLPVGADPADGHIHPLETAELLVSRRRFGGVLTQARVYRGRPNPQRQAGAARANDRQTSDWDRRERVEVIRRNLDYPDDWPTAAAVEKGIDVAIAVDMIRPAITSEMDVAVLFSSDKDLLPALETLRDHTSCHVEVAAWSQAPRLRFGREQLPWCHYLNEADFASVRDRFDYSEP